VLLFSIIKYEICIIITHQTAGGPFKTRTTKHTQKARRGNEVVVTITTTVTKLDAAGNVVSEKVTTQTETTQAS
jgi:hypothetical protein